MKSQVHNIHNKNSKHELSLSLSRELFLKVVLVVGGVEHFDWSTWDLSYETCGSCMIVILLVEVV